MLDKTQASVAHVTVVNATSLACSIASRVLGTSVADKLHGESVTRNTINRIVIEEIRATHMSQEKTNVV